MNSPFGVCTLMECTILSFQDKHQLFDPKASVTLQYVQQGLFPGNFHVVNLAKVSLTENGRVSWHQSWLLTNSSLHRKAVNESSVNA